MIRNIEDENVALFVWGRNQICSILYPCDISSIDQSTAHPDMYLPSSITPTQMKRQLYNRLTNIEYSHRFGVRFLHKNCLSIRSYICVQSDEKCPKPASIQYLQPVHRQG